MLRTDARADSWIARAKAVSIEDAAAFVGAVLKPPHAPERCGPCPFCGGHDRFSINVKKGVFNCRGTEGGGPIDLVMHCRGTDFLTACEVLTGEPRPQGSREESDFERQARETKIIERQEAAERSRIEQENKEATNEEREAAQIEKTLVAMRPVAGTHAEAYLRARGLSMGQWADGLGFIADARYFDGGGTVVARVPLMLAPIVFAPTGNVIGIHRTYLDPVEPKKFCPPDGGSKKFYGRAQGGLIPLGPIGETLAVGEGIETSAAFAQNPDLGGEIDGLSIAAAASLGNMCGACTGTRPHPNLINPKTGKPVTIANGEPDLDRPGMILPPQVKRLILLGDGDSERLMTRALLMAAGKRYRAQGLAVTIQMAPDGRDFASLAA